MEGKRKAATNPEGSSPAALPPVQAQTVFIRGRPKMAEAKGTRLFLNPAACMQTVSHTGLKPDCPLHTPS